jgi:polyisoprenyl-phosphate glycosyltransferase
MNETRMLLSVVVPAYAEESALPVFHQELMRALAGLEGEFDVEVIYVDDGSPDGTLAVLREIAAASPRAQYLSLSRNFGHQAALTAGLDHARGGLVVTLDADLQHPPEVIPLLIDEWKKGADVVLTIRADDPSLKWSKRFSSWLFYRTMQWMSGTEVRPSAADFRLMTRTAVDALLSLRESHRFVRGMVNWLGFPCREVRFTPNQRIAGRSKYTFRKQLSLGLDGMFSFSKLPLRLATGLGGLLAVGGAASALWLGLATAAGWAADPAFWLLLIGMQLIGGATLLALGIVGEYVGRIYEQVKQRPTYLLKESSISRGAGQAIAPRTGVGGGQRPMAA